MSNSSLVTYRAMTSHYGYSRSGAPEHGRYGQKIDKIFVHHMAGNLTVQQCGNVFKTRTASAHYGINGKNIGQYVDEGDVAWHCGNKSYNIRSIGIECANDGGASKNWHVSDTTIQTLIKLIVDICKRNGIKWVNYTGGLDGNLCQHCWTQSTACPGGFLKSKFKYITDQCNKQLEGGSDPEPAPAPAPKTELYRVRKTWADAKSQAGAYKVLANAKKVAAEKHLNVYDSTGKLVYSGETAQLYRVRKSWSDIKSQLGAYKLLTNAKKKADANPGYKVFDEAGKVVYDPKPTVNPNMTKFVKAVTDEAAWSYGSTYKWEQNPTVAKSKKNGTCVTFVACVLQRYGALKPGEWIYFEKGKVYGTTSGMEVIYPGEKTPAQLKAVLRKGDIVMHDDTKSGHIEIYAGEMKDGKAHYWTGGTGSGHNTSLVHWNSRKIFAIVRLKSIQ